MKVTSSELVAIAERHRLPVGDVSMRPWIGGGSCVYPLGSGFVVKVPHAGAAPISSLAVEVAAARAAYAAGVRTAGLIGLDESLEILPVPYLVFERIEGEPLSHITGSSATVERTWRDVGTDLAMLHGRVTPDESLRVIPSFPQTAENDPRPWVDDVQRLGMLTPGPAEWLAGLLKRLAPLVTAPAATAFCHGDVNAANVMVDWREPRRYAGLLDWGGAGWADPASDFSAVPLKMVPAAVAGYRGIAPLADDASAEARILWFYLRLALFGLRRSSVTSLEKEARGERLVRDTAAYLMWARIS